MGTTELIVVVVGRDRMPELGYSVLNGGDTVHCDSFSHLRRFLKKLTTYQFIHFQLT
jgi:hypothetical protein